MHLHGPHEPSLGQRATQLVCARLPKVVVPHVWSQPFVVVRLQGTTTAGRREDEGTDEDVRHSAYHASHRATISKIAKDLRVGRSRGSGAK